MRIAICDDEKIVRDYLHERIRAVLSQLDTDAEVELFDDGDTLAGAYSTGLKPFDVIFLDIKMDRLGGMEAAKLIRRYDSEVFIVFITSSAEYVFSGYEVKAYRYILKTELSYSFDNVFKDVLREMNKSAEQLYTFQFSNDIVSLPTAEILYFESNKRIALIHTEKGEYKTYEKLDSIEELLKDKDFVRTHQSFLVNAAAIRQFKGNSIILKNGEELPVSKKHQRSTNEAYLWAIR